MTFSHLTYTNSTLQAKPHLLLQILIEPLHRLIKRLLLSKLNRLLTQIRLDRKPMLDMREEINLIRHADFLEYLFGLVSLFGRKDTVDI